MNRVPWERVKEWAEKRRDDAHLALLKEQPESESARLRIQYRVYADLLDLEREKDGV